jgi:hypothetical protein
LGEKDKTKLERKKKKIGEGGEEGEAILPRMNQENTLKLEFTIKEFWIDGYEVLKS